VVVFRKLSITLVLVACFSSCMENTNPFEVVGIGAKERDGNRDTTQAIKNGPATLPDPNTGRVLLDSPFGLAPDFITFPLTAAPNLNFLLSEPLVITENPVLQESCEGNSSGVGEISQCHEVKADVNSTPLASVERRWGFDANSNEFAQVNAFYHQNKLIKNYHQHLLNYFNTVAQPSVDPSLNFATALPANMYETGAHFYQGTKLKTYANCPQPDNANFSIADFSICLGFSSLYPEVKVAHDPSVLVHELGHTFSQIQLNMRTIAKTTDFPYRSDIGYFFYDENGAINEGVADYYGHSTNHRDEAFDYIFNSSALTGEGGSRPISEANSKHATGISTDEEDRLAYPQFITYMPDTPTEVIEDVHFGGMIASHFLVALKKDMEDFCKIDKDIAGNDLINLLSETYSYLGDLSTTGNDFFAEGSVNHLKNNNADGYPISLEWFSKVRPVNFKRLFQTFSRFFIANYSKTGSTRCDGGEYSKDRLEKLLDSYGLLLFENYNEDGNHHTNGHNGSSVTVTNNIVEKQNRLKSIMVSKDLLEVDSREGKVNYFIFDKGNDIRQIVDALLSSGRIGALSEHTDPDLKYNNGNGFVSPGEVVGISLNVYNDSNTTLGGLQVLASDWDHGKMEEEYLRPCGTLSDSWPTEFEGGVGFDETTTVRGNCNHTTRDHGLNILSTSEASPKDEVLSPICFIQITEGNATYWGSQKEYADNIGLESSSCLGGSSDTNDCIIRVIPGADSSWHSKVDPNSTWAETLLDINGNPTFGIHNLFLLEVNKNITPGTKFYCRARARFTNCKDCWFNENEYNGDDYLDYEFSGEKPFKVLGFEFTVVD